MLVDRNSIKAAVELKRFLVNSVDPQFVMYQSPTTNQPNQLNGYSPVPVYPVYGEVPVDVCCPYCQTRVFTVTTKEDGNLTYFSASLLCFMG